MTGRNRTILLILLLVVVSIGTAAWYLISRAGVRSGTPVTTLPSRRHQPVRAPAPDLVTPEKVRSLYSLKPDARFLAAFAEVNQFLGIKGAPAPELTFRGDYWTLKLPQMEPAKLTLYPDFPELESLLEQYTTLRVKETGFSLSVDSEAPKDLIVQRYLSGSPLEALQAIEQE